eukprot:COSAG04_NODE_7914_length_1047_cov_1.000000_1_plen_73_part_01
MDVLIVTVCVLLVVVVVVPHCNSAQHNGAPALPPPEAAVFTPVDPLPPHLRRHAGDPAGERRPRSSAAHAPQR